MISHGSADVALVFPGQGAYAPELLDEARSAPEFALRYSTVCDVLGYRPDAPAADRLGQSANAADSAIAVLASAVALDRYQRDHGAASMLAGYSVGQWAALYAAGCLSFEDLLRVVKRRAECMDECFRENPGGMLAVIGVTPEALDAVCGQLRNEGFPVFISNFNAYGQYSLSGTQAAIERASERVRALGPKRLVRLPVSGAWHCPLVAAAEAPFAAYLVDVTIRRPTAIVIDNVTGRPFDWSADIRAALVPHLSHPVLWDAGIRELVARGGRTFIELGLGNTLTKFGFFIDRTVRHTTFHAA